MTSSRGKPGGPANGAPKLPAAVDRCILAIRSMIVRGELLPGEKIRQEALAEQLGVSRIPVREALKVLESEWIVTGLPNVGFTVARFDASHLTQVYRMRELLETELVGSIGPASPEVIDRLRRLNRDVERAGIEGHYHDVIVINREFHFTMFTLTDQDLLLAEVRRLWDMSDFYRSLYAYDPVARERVLAEHEGIIDAFAAGDRDELVARLAAHRNASRSHVEKLIRPGPTSR